MRQLFLCFLFCASRAIAQDGTLDGTYTYSTGADGAVEHIRVLNTGKILVTGGFFNYEGRARIGIIKLNADGSVDVSNNVGTGANGTVYEAAVDDATGDIYIVGTFNTFNGTTRNRIARLNSDGSLDGGFDPATGFNAPAETIALQSDGKILVGGSFTSYQGTTQNYITRLNPDGTLDGSFSIGTGASQQVYQVLPLSDGDILISGTFQTYNGTAKKYIARLNSDGSLDAAFNTGTGPDGSIRYVALQPDGKIVVVGQFNNYDGVGRNRVARLNSDGSLDATFNPGTGANATVMNVTRQADGKFLIGGFFATVNGTSRSGVARLTSTGSLDATFDPGTGTNFQVESIALQADGKVLIGGGFTSYNGTPRNRIARLSNTVSVLPVTLLSFTGKINGDIIDLVWTTATESDNKGFEVQRSTDGNNFNKAGFIPSKGINGQSSQLLHYSFAEKKSGFTTYYRLKQTDFDGKFEYSNVLPIKDDQVSFQLHKIYPQPATSQLTFYLTSLRNEKISVIVYDQLGQVVQKETKTVFQGENYIHFDIQKLSSGSYIIGLADPSGGRQTLRFQKL